MLDRSRRPPLRHLDGLAPLDARRRQQPASRATTSFSPDRTGNSVITSPWRLINSSATSS
jgi:hypothetical protein